MNTKKVSIIILNWNRWQYTLECVESLYQNNYSNYLKKLSLKLGINDKIIFTGPLYGKDKLEAYSDADIYVLP